MEMKSSLRRAQSLKHISTESQQSWRDAALWEKGKSVSQLVAQYQTSLDLKNADSEEQKQKILARDDPPDTKFEALLKTFESRQKPKKSAHYDNGNLLRSKSMEHLPRQGETSISSLLAIFESTSPLKETWRSPQVKQGLTADKSVFVPSKRERPVTRIWQKVVTSAEVKETESIPTREEQAVNKNVTHGWPDRFLRGEMIGGLSPPLDKTMGQAQEKRLPRLDHQEAPSAETQTREKSLNSVKERSALYLPKVTAVDLPGSPIKPDNLAQQTVIITGNSPKTRKMADKTKKIKVSAPSNGAHVEDDLPPPPPPRPQQEELPAAEEQSVTFVPVPPPKETFSTFYQQRQKNELKRLFRHMHPELRKNLEDVVNQELVEVLSSEDTQASVEAGYQGEVQSMRWIFENWALDSIGDPHSTKKMLEEEALMGGNVKGTSSVFEHQDSDSTQIYSSVGANVPVRGDVHAAAWLFETQPLDSLNKIHPEEGDIVEAVLKETVQRGDVKGAKLLFESYPLDALGRCNSVEDHSFLKLKSEIHEQKGDVQTTVKLFETEPCCAIRDSTGNIHKVTSICREEIQSSSVRSARWLFETQPFDVINRKESGVQIIRGISLEEDQKGGVERMRWMFETQPLDTIHESIQEPMFQATTEQVEGADVGNKWHPFETQPLASLKGEFSDESRCREEIVGGAVRSTLWLFETQPMENLKDNYEVGRLQKITVTDEERGTVQNRKHVFETCTLDTINKELTEGERKGDNYEIEKGDVKSYKHLFETIPLGNISQSEDESVEKCHKVVVGNVKSSRELFQTTPLYAIKDCSGNYYEVTTVSREQIVHGNVQKYKWMFETRPLDQFEEEKVEIIRGITKQEDQTGDVKTTKWLFETQSQDRIHSQVNQTEKPLSNQRETLQSGDVKTCRWLFETQPMDILYEKSEKKQEEETLPKTDVKSYTWLFETQPLDTLNDLSERHLKLCNTSQDGLKAADLKTERHLFETEDLDSTGGTDGEKEVKYVSQVDVQSGDVSRVKEIFETKSLDEIGTASVKISEALDDNENIQRGSVRKFTWLFENCPIDAIKEPKEEEKNIKPCSISEVEGGNVGNKRFIFETFSLDQIHDEDQTLDHTSVSVKEPLNKGDVKSCTMLFETQPLYAITDKDGQFHEVTTVKKEEIISGDVRGARWMFETKPLDTIKPQDEIFVIRAVTQEDVLKGDVKTARWRFETQPLSSLTSQDKMWTRNVDDVQKGDVKFNKELFESQEVTQKKYVRMVSVTDAQHGDVRTSTWLFENQPIDSLKGELQEKASVPTVHREDNHKGDVKRCTWLFETQPLDSLKDSEPKANIKVQEEVPLTDVKSTTWLFESTPLDRLSFQNTVETETVVQSVKETLHRLYYFNAVRSQGIVIEANEARSVKMAKYQLTNKEGPEIQKEEVVEGNIRGIMLQLLQKTNIEPQGVLLKEDEQGNVQITKLELSVNQPLSNITLDAQFGKDDVAQAVESLLNQDKSLKKGILIQETERGHAEMTVYSLHSNHKNGALSQEIIKGDVKSTIGSLLASAQETKSLATFKLEENEKGNVNLYRSCIEKGDLKYLKSLQTDASEDEPDSCSGEQTEILQGDVKGAKKHLNQQNEQVERTVVDIVPGDVKNVKKVFSSERGTEIGNVQKEEIICGDVSSAKQSLGEASNHPTVVEKEEIVSGDIKATLKALERAKNQSMRLERETVVPGKIYDLNVELQETSADVSEAKPRITEDVSSQKQESKQTYQVERHVVMEDTQSSDLQAAMQSLRQATAEAKTLQHVVQGKQQTVTQGNIQHEKQKTASVQHARTMQTSKQLQKTAVQMKETTCCSRKESATSTRSEEKVTSAYLKVSDSVEMQGTSQNFEACQESKVTQSTDININKEGPQPVLSVVNPFFSSDYDAQSSQEKTETEAVVRGDVKAAIKSLRSAATEQKPVEKEDIVRGNLQAALQSLEKSNINVSKGDFKAAMIYRNAGQSYSECRKKKDTTSVCNQSVFISVPPSDAELSPPVSVTDGEQQPPATVSKATITSSNKDETANKPFNSSNLISNSEIPPPLPLKTCEKLTTQKPALPPKPEHLNKGPCGAPASRPVPPPKPQHLREKQHTPVIPIKVKQQLPAKPSPVPMTPEPLSNSQDVFITKSTDKHSKNYLPAKVLTLSRKQDMDCENTGIHAAYFDTKKENLTEIDKTLQFVDLNKEKKKILTKETVEELQSAAKTKIPTCEVIENNKSVPQSINAVEEIRGYMQYYSENSEIKNFQTALQNFDDKKKSSGQLSSSVITKKGVVVTAPPLPKKAKVIQNEEKKEISKSETNTCLRQRTTVSEQNGTYRHGQQQNSQTEHHRPSVEVTFSHRLEEQQEQPESKVVLREKKGRRETEDERRQRLSVHKDEIMRGNVKAAMEIFENLRKREELKIILSKVEEIEGETCKVDVRHLKNLFENVPEWVVGPGKSLKNNKPKGEQKVEKTETLKDDTESMSSVEVVFGDLERASVEIINLKEQTLARLMDIEEAIKKALYSVSNLKSESDIAGLSGLFKESLGTEQNSVTPNNIRKISIVSSKAKLEHSKETFGNNTNENILLSEKTDKVEKTGLEVPVIKPNSPSSPSYISIQSAARKPTEPLKSEESMSIPSEKQVTAEKVQSDCINSKPECEPKNTHGTNGDPDKCPDLSQQEALSNVYSPLSPRRQKSVLEVKTVPEAAGIVGTKTVMEKYEETDCFGNKFVTSKTSTIVTKQSETKTSSTYEVVASPTKYEVMTSPQVRRSAHHFSEGPQTNCKVKEGGTVFVTFGHPKTGGKH
ncbi:xin actin-binding repeat-containing protein 1 isoform X1 [Lepisosteus oculatus]|uniref:xin actin-binding repeat-containing protein 1 isoform X1 n=1 Tax=Lepisosteus oculatus TaxID=7918 RepID=UPI003715CB1B